MASSVSGQDNPNPAAWLATRWCYFAHSGLPGVCWKKIINPLLTKLDWSTFYKHKIYFGQYPSILTSNSVNNPYITTHNSSRQVKRLFHSLTPGEIAFRAQSKTLEKIQRNIAGKPGQLKTSEARMVKWIKEYNRGSWKDLQGLGRSFLSWSALLENVADLYKCSCGGDDSLLSC